MFVESTSSCLVDGLITVYAHTFLEEQTFLLTERRTQAEAKHSELSLETPDELPLGTADELPLEIPDGPSRSDRQAVGRAHADLNFTDVEYFANRYSAFLKFTPKELDALFDEFADYQLLESADISGDIWKAARAHYQVEEGDEERKEAFPRIDVIWAFLTKMKSADGCRQRFANLARIAQLVLVLVLPHSNAGEERIFSLVRLNKTSYRSSLSLDGTLSSILTIKTHIPDSFIKFDPPKEMLEKAKKATTEYNKKHRKEPAKT